MQKPIQVFGNVGSPYTQKILALLRYRNIPYTISWGDVIHNLSLLGLQPPKPVLLPTLIFNNKDVRTDTTPIIRYLEDIYSKKSVIPNSSSVNFLNYLLEDFADEWTTKYMFHYRWHFKEDAENAKKMLVLQHKLNIDNDAMNGFANAIAERQIDRLWVVGSSDDTAELIDDSYKRFLKLLENHLTNSPYMFGLRPSSSDFGLYGQLTQLVGFDPTPRHIASQESPRCVSWVSIMSDLSGLHNMGGIGEFFGINDDSINNKNINYFEDNNDGWYSLNQLPKSLKEIFNEIGKVYIPCLIANNEAYINNEETWEIELDGSTWRQKTFPYQSKCLNWIKDEFNILSEADKNDIKIYLEGTGCELILD
jgi:glutathione S-transferase